MTDTTPARRAPTGPDQGATGAQPSCGNFAGGRKGRIMADAETPVADDPRMRRLHNLFFGLIYPAFLGTFVVSMFLKTATPDLRWIAWILCIYLAIQFAEGAEKKDRYRWHTALLHFLEVVLMATIFAGIGFLNPDAAAKRQFAGPVIGGLVALLLLLPVIRRVIFFRKQAFCGPNRRFYYGISGLAVVAALLAFGIFHPLARSFLTAMLIFYFLAVVAAPAPPAPPEPPGGPRPDAGEPDA